MTTQKTKQKRLGIAELTLIGLIVGIACGLFFGEEAARLKIIGDAYVQNIRIN